MASHGGIPENPAAIEYSVRNEKCFSLEIA
jgi:hypothetical protein